jgi:hypothetical protein
VGINAPAARKSLGTNGAMPRLMFKPLSSVLSASARRLAQRALFQRSSNSSKDASLLGALTIFSLISCSGGAMRAGEQGQGAVGSPGDQLDTGEMPTIFVSTSEDRPLPGHCSFREAVHAANTGVATGGCPPGDPLGTTILLDADVALNKQENITIQGSIHLYTSLEHRPQITGRSTAIVVTPTGKLKVDRIRFSGFTTTVLFVDATTTQGGVLELVDSEISDNIGPIANVETVGILNNGGYVSIEGCLLQRNVDSIRGGALLNNGGVVDINNTSITENAAGHGGGGIFNGSNGTMRIFNSTISGNRQTSDAYGGGGIFNASGDVHIDFSTIANNVTAVDGSGVKNATGVVTMKRSIVTGNLVSGPFGGSGFDCTGEVNSAGYNLHGDCRGWTAAVGDQEIWDAKLEPLSLQEGLSTRYLRVKQDSPARDAIPAGEWCPGSSPRDQVAQPRPNSVGCEVGAVELY